MAVNPAMPLRGACSLELALATWAPTPPKSFALTVFSRDVLQEQQEKELPLMAPPVCEALQ